MAPRNPQFSLYLPRTLLAWQADDPERQHLAVEGTTLFADISGFTPLVERMSALGRAGSEEVSDLINRVFDEIIAVGADEGGDVLKFGGDACLLLYTGEDHAARAARTALDMQDVLDEFDLPEFGISIGFESGEVHLAVVGDLHRELLVLGPAIDRTLEAEKLANTGEVVAGPNATKLLPESSFADGLLVDAPDDGAIPSPVVPGSGDALDLADYIPVRLRDALSVAGADGEHRHAAAAFVRVSIDVGSVDAALIAELDQFTSLLQQQCERHEVAFLGCDVDVSAIKFLICAGAPASPHLEEERILRTLRRVMDEAGELSVTMGVTRGLLFAGDIGATSRRYYSLLGDSVNLAARLMGAASPGQILTLDSVLERSPTRFSIERLPPLTLKGKSKPVAAVSVGAIAGLERVDWARFLPLTGRDSELASLVAGLADVRAGTGSVFEIVGDSGVGKTRLMDELLDRATMVDSHEVICQHYETSSPYFVIGHLLRGAMALKPDSDLVEVETRLDEVLVSAPQLAPWRPLIAIPLQIAVEETDESRALSPEFRNERMNQSIREFLEVLRPGSMVVAVEDAHWLDAASRGVLDHLMGQSGSHPWMFLLTRHRADGWVSIPGSTELELEVLDQPATTDLIRFAARETPVSDDVLATIVERSGGHPFFALELLRHADNETLPESVESVIAERIDRLEARDRQLLRYVAVLGNSFAFDLLAEALPQVAPSAEDTDTWQRLSEFLDVTVFGTVQFKQDLIRLAAYEGLTYRRRREVHGIIGEAIERRARRRVNRQASLLSQHYFLAEHWDKAWQFSLIAAQQAREAYAVVDAVRLFERALSSAPHVEAADDEAVAEVNEWLAEVAAKAGMPDRSQEALAAALELRPSDGVHEARLTRKLAANERDRGEFEPALAHLDRALAVAERALGSADDDTRAVLELELVEILVVHAGITHRTGDFAESNAIALRAMSQAEAIGAKSSFAGAALITITNNVSLGIDGDRDHGIEALAVFEELGDPHGRAKVLNNLGYRSYYSGDWVETVGLWEQSEAEYRAAGDAIGAATAGNNLGEVLADQGLLDEAEDRLQEALRAWRAARFRLGVAVASQNLGRVTSRRREPAEARRQLMEAYESFAAVGQNAYVADTALRLAEVYAYSGSVVDLQKALAILPDETAEGTLAPARCRLEALVACRLDPDNGERLLREAVEVARSAGVPFEEAQTLRLLADLFDDRESGEAAAAILERLGAARAVPFSLPT